MLIEDYFNLFIYLLAVDYNINLSIFQLDIKGNGC